MHVIIEFGDLVGWILFGIFVVVFGTWLVALLIREKYRRWKEKRQERKEDQKGGAKR